MAASDPYYTINEPGEAELRVQGSEFYGIAEPVDRVAAAESVIDQLRQKYPDASHHVPAYRVRITNDSSGSFLRSWSSDDGEPAGSAGKPILNILEQREVENVVVVVVRYFGGTELGVGGLARAYSATAKATLEDAGIVETVPKRQLRVETAYADSGTIRGLLESFEVDFEATYEAAVQFDVWVPVGELDRVRERLQDATSGRVSLEVAE